MGDRGFDRGDWIIVAVVVMALAGLFVLGRRNGAAAPVRTEGPPATGGEVGEVLEGPVLTAPPDPTSPSTTLTPTTLHGEIEGRSTDPLADQEPLVALLPHAERTWRIDYDRGPEGLRLTVTVRAALNRPDQLARYQADLAAGREAAVAWLRAQGQDPAAIPITWVPKEAAP